LIRACKLVEVGLSIALGVDGTAHNLDANFLRYLCSPLGRKPLIRYTIDSEHRATQIHRILVSTEDEEIASIWKSLGAEVLFLRPASLAEDDTPMLRVIVYAIEPLVAEGWLPDAVCLQQPTFPFRRPEDIDACIEASKPRRPTA